MIPGNLYSRRVLRVARLLVVIVSVGFVVVLLRSQWGSVVAWRPSPLAVVILLGATLSYAAAGLLLASAWRSILLWSGETAVSVRDAFHIYGRSQLAKYIPGNIAQLIGRHLLGRQRGWSHTGLVVAGVFELISLVGAAAMVATLGVLLDGAMAANLGSSLQIMFAAGLVFAGIVTFRVMPRLVARVRPDIALRLQQCRMLGLWPAYLLHLGFFAVVGLIFLVTSFAVADTGLPLSLWPTALALLASAWIIGIVTPGAPSGLGVREAVLVFGLSVLMPVAQALLMVGLFRFVTVTGDIVFFFAGGLQSPSPDRAV